MMTASGSLWEMADTLRVGMPQVPLLVLAPGAHGFGKRWPSERYAELATRSFAGFFFDPIGFVENRFKTYGDIYYAPSGGY